MSATLAACTLAVACTDAPSAPPREPNAPRSAAPVILGGQLANVTALDLGTLPGFYHHSARAVNQSGWVVGTAEAQTGTARRAFIWKPGAGMSDLGALTGFAYSVALAINAPGDIAGYSYTADDQTPRATLWHGGAAISLGALTSPGVSVLGSVANAVNNAGVVVGSSETGLSAPSPRRLAFRWTQATGMLPLFAPPGTVISEAAAINNAGQIVGYVQSEGAEPHAALWDGTSFTDLGVLPGGAESRANAINEGGVVVGFSTFSSPWHHAFRWTQAGGMTDLGTLSGSVPLGPTSEALGINDAGDIVGIAQASQGGSNPAVLWRGGTIYTLPPLTGGVENGTARDINDNGQIVGSVDPLGLATHAVMWTLASNRPPVANAGGPYEGRKKKEAIVFDGSQSGDPDGDALTFVWSFGDGTPTAAGANVSHVYDRLGTYTAMLTVSDGNGGTSTATVTVQILPPGKLDR